MYFWMGTQVRFFLIPLLSSELELAYVMEDMVSVKVVLCISNWKRNEKTNKLTELPTCSAYLSRCYC